MNTEFNTSDWGSEGAYGRAKNPIFAGEVFAGQMIGFQADLPSRRAIVVDLDARKAQGPYETHVLDGQDVLYSGKVLAVVANQANRHVAPTPALSGYNA